ncbi:MAG: histidinol dehydrogenase [Candidatus Helarchaeota archaeon]|nr:histidinol dehydrogenase [Candidatus Helarchaeota archaeon]
MLETVTINDFKKQYLEKVINRGKVQFEDVSFAVSKIISEVKQRGDAALLSFTEKFDGIKLNKDELAVNKDEIKEAYKKIDSKFLDVINIAKNNIEKYHQAQFREPWFIETSKGVSVGQIMKPYKRVGLYIPGGRAPYPSTVLMTAVPAKVAKVKEVILCTPPQKKGNIDPYILVAANEVGIDKIFKVGGAQAIAAMAYGTSSIPKVEKIVGPGNIYVQAAKQIVNVDVRIDLPAGPSEVLIISDENSNPNFIATDILSQAEHEPGTFCFLLTTSSEIAKATISKLNKLIPELPKKEFASEALEKNGFFILVESIEEAIQLANEIAPEHLEIQIKDPKSVLDKIENAGSIFLGDFSPVPLGDFAAGSNHVLPSGGAARYYSGLSIMDYVKLIDVIESTKEGLNKLKDCVVNFAKVEGFQAHANSIMERFKPNE